MTAHTLNRQRTPKKQRTVQYSSEQSSQSSLSHAFQNSFLVIGYGNALHGDDAIGAQVTNRVDSWQLPQVHAITVRQLTPALVPEIANVDYAIFVDACGHQSCARNVQIEPLSAIANHTRNLPSTQTTLTHHQSAQALIELTYQRYGYAPQAWRIRVPVERVDLEKKEDALSSTAQHGIDEAVQTIERFLMHYSLGHVVCNTPIG